MKKFYAFVVLTCLGMGGFAQQLTLLSKQRAEKIAKQRNFNEEETARFVEKATTTGVDLTPSKNFPSKRQSASTTGAANNINFELQDFTGWMGQYASSNCTSPTPNTATSFTTNFTSLNTASDQHGICTSGFDATEPTLPCVSPFGGLASCRLGDVMDGCGSSYLSQTFTVGASDTILFLYYALILYDGHPVPDAPKFKYTLKDSTGAVFHTLYWDAVNAANPNSGFSQTAITGLYYRPWDADTCSLKNYVGQDITIDVYSSDCNGGAHRGYAYIDFDFYGHAPACGLMPPASICFVTTDDSLHNEVFLDHHALMPNSGGTIIYRQNSMSLWDSIGFVAAAQPDVFVDMVANPNQQSFSYRAAMRDSCGTVYSTSATHTTVFLQSSLGTNNSVNLSWNAYVGAPVASYLIYRGTSPSNMTLLNQVSSSTFAYTDLTPPNGNVYYSIKFAGPANCTSNAPHDSLVGSNFRTYNIVSVNNPATVANFQFYPNPANTSITIDCPNLGAEISVIDMLGNVVKQATNKTGRTAIDIKSLPEGMYLVTVNKGVVRKLVVQH